ncbi:hypothetical protein NEOLEDRAFT_413236 [Neolentinus lepideus HHB14362 ss-1]|uniref:Uncharacterized protein n=1 Tax=Neolentinus lepideus HHB14362 ss-1 TaxID=1314782 RepID=A0A165S5I5_9AGAM|nr:hypothetical protein NEOLEDRAFT_413236 [Neolentinus lepideus HHB14362 ss-1]
MGTRDVDLRRCLPSYFGTRPHLCNRHLLARRSLALVSRLLPYRLLDPRPTFFPVNILIRMFLSSLSTIPYPLCSMIPSVPFCCSFMSVINAPLEECMYVGLGCK